MTSADLYTCKRLKKKPLHNCRGSKKASYGTRTRDIQLGKLALYQLSQTRILNTEAHQNPVSRSLLMRFVGTRQAKSDHFRRLPII